MDVTCSTRKGKGTLCVFWSENLKERCRLEHLGLGSLVKFKRVSFKRSVRVYKCRRKDLVACFCGHHNELSLTFHKVNKFIGLQSNYQLLKELHDGIIYLVKRTEPWIVEWVDKYDAVFRWDLIFLNGDMFCAKTASLPRHGLCEFV
jgi:hypothetical protein